MIIKTLFYSLTFIDCLLWFLSIEFLKDLETFEQPASNATHKEHEGCAAAGMIYLWQRLCHF